MFLLLIAGILIAFSAPVQAPPPGYRPAEVLLGTAVLTAVGALSGLLLYLAAPRPVFLTSEEHLAWERRVSRLIWLGRGILLGSYLYTVHGLGWPVFVWATLGLQRTIALDYVVILAPFLASVLGALIIGFPAQRRTSGRDWTLGSYLVFVLRHYWAFLLIPWFLYVVALDVMEMLVEPGLDQTWRAPLEWLVVLGLMALLYAFWPLALRWIWSTSRLPDGALAAVAGLAAPVRYILLTDTLLERLGPQEVEAVLGHELGHVRRRHIPYYVLFAVGFIALAVVADIWLGGALPEPSLSPGAEASLLDLLVAVVLVGAYWGVLFGWLSRRFEREADLVAADMVGDAEVFAQALERIARINGRPLERPGWRHFSIAERTRFVREAAVDSALGTRAVAQVILIRRALLAATMVAVAAGLACVLL